uniref:Paxillin n=1 Tax=Panagrellus redivivus TaxID=6233 RepID=A0A7E4V113_PANRE
MLAELEHNLSRFNSRRSLGNGTLPNASSYSLNRGLTKDPSQMGSMIGGLSPDANRHGIHTIPKGDCAACDRPIIGQIVMAMGKMWHPEHYVCCHCGIELGQQNYIERGGKAYCENDYHDLFSPRCVVCNGAVKDRCVTAMGKNYHPQHFVCVECGRPFGPEGYHEKDGHAYCKTDFYRLFAPKCTGCQKPVGARFLTALGSTWHPECFACNDCSRQFSNGIYFEANGVPLCEQHFHERRGSLCGSCHGPINGKCVAALGQRFHPEHFGCSSCNRVLNARNFKDHGGQAFCQKCYEKSNPSFTVLS